LRHGVAREIRPEYVIQLKLYAALYHEGTGSWPARLELVPLNGEVHEVPYSSQESLKLLEHARSLLRQVNDDLASHASDWEAVEQALAVPSAAACKFCAYRPACSAYLARDSASDPDWPADIWGTFRDLTTLGNGRLLLSLTRSDGSISYVRDLSTEIVEPAGLGAIGEGTWVGAFNVWRTRSPRAFEQGPLTWIYSAKTDVRDDGDDAAGMRKAPA
jgi:hypothetical protein